MLHHQKESGKDVLKTLLEIQSEVIIKMASKRKCQDLLQGQGSRAVDLSKQPNFFKLEVYGETHAILDMQKIDKIILEAENLLCISWADISKSISRSFSKVPKDSLVYHKLSTSSIVIDREVFKACGLGKSRPLQDLKATYQKCKRKEVSEKEDNTNNNNKNVLATFISNFAAMAFGKNLIMEDGGIFLQDGVCGCPDLLVTNLSRNEIIYSVVFVSVDIQIFHVTEEMLTT